MPSLTKVQTGFLEPQGAFTLDVGTASAPGLKFSDSAATGMFSPSTGVLGFSTSGAAQALTITTGGNVGIGTTNPSAKLHVVGGGKLEGNYDITNRFEFQSGDGFLSYGLFSAEDDMTIYGRYDTHLGLVINPATGSGYVGGIVIESSYNRGSDHPEVITLNTNTVINGNVGVGFINPSIKLEVNGQIQGIDYSFGNTGASQQWVKLGSVNLPQGGVTCKVKVYYMSGYNANNNQDNYLEVFFKTSNGSSTDANGFYGNSWYYIIGPGSLNTQGPKWVDTGNGNYDLYILIPNFSGSSKYNVETLGRWTHAGSMNQTDPGSGSATVLISTHSWRVLSGASGFGYSAVNQALFCQSDNNHYIVGQASDGVPALEVYSQHGGDVNKVSFAVKDNRTGSKSSSLIVKGDGAIGIGTDSPDAGTFHIKSTDNLVKLESTRGTGHSWSIESTGTNSEGINLYDRNNNARIWMYLNQSGYAHHTFHTVDPTYGSVFRGAIHHNTISFNQPTTGDGDDYAAIAHENDYSAWGLIFKRSWLGGSAGWGTYWAGNSGALYRRESGDTNPNEYVFLGAGNKRFTFDLNSGGNAYFDGTLTQNAYDYAEYFEWEDGNVEEEDRRGYSVFINANGKIEKATSETDPSDIIGVISGTVAVLGDAAMYDWQGKYQVDEWGTRITEKVTQISWTDDEGINHNYKDISDVPEDVVIPEDAGRKVHDRFIESPDYDPEQEYIPRDKRKEWDPVGLLGKVRVRDESPKNPNWKLIKVVNGKELWLIR